MNLVGNARHAGQEQGGEDAGDGRVGIIGWCLVEVAGGCAIDGGGARVGGELTDEYSQQGALAAAVGTDHTKYPANGDGERDAIEDGTTAEFDSEVGYANHGHLLGCAPGCGVFAKRV